MKCKHVSVREKEGIEQLVILSSCFKGCEEEEGDCWLNHNIPLTFTVYTSDSSKEYYQEHKKNVDECMLRVILQTPELDKSAHFLIISGYNYKAKRFESNVVVFTDMCSKIYQQHLLCSLQNECDTELIHCSSDVIHSPHWWIQKQLLNHNTDVHTVYSNCHYCLGKVRKAFKP